MSTFLSLHYHLVFSTKRREPTIGASWQNRPHEYLGGIVIGLEGKPQGIGGTGDRNFAWQEGYGAFTISPTSRKEVVQYIANQEEHHRTRSFREEFTTFLEKAGVDYDPKYLE